MSLFVNNLTKIRNNLILKRYTTIIPHYSKDFIRLLESMKRKGEIIEVEILENNFLKVEISPSISTIKAVTRRYYTKVKGILKYEKRFLLTRHFGNLYITTSTGILTAKECKAAKIGGALLAYTN